MALEEQDRLAAVFIQFQPDGSYGASMTRAKVLVRDGVVDPSSWREGMPQHIEPQDVAEVLGEVATDLIAQRDAAVALATNLQAQLDALTHP